jgi:ABC-type oligopeptide transport system substrate-binding subunit
MCRAISLILVLAALVAAQVPLASPELKQAAAETRVPAIKALYEAFAVPFDKVFLREDKEYRVRPIPAPPGRDGLKGTFKIVSLDPVTKEKAEALTKYPGADILAHSTYEKLALAGVDDFLKKQEALPPLERLGAAERVLAAVLQFHDSERQDGVRKGPGWEKLRDMVRDRLMAVRREQLEARTTARDWEQAIALARRLLDTYATAAGEDRPPEGLANSLHQLVVQLNAAKLDDEPKLALLEQLSKVLRPHKERKAAERAIGELQTLAKAALREADKANERTPPDVVQAQAFLARVEKLWPELEELNKFELRVKRPDSILRVGVRELPEFLSPALAATDNERRGVELLFDSLVKPQRDDQGLLTYRPALADGPPVVIPQGRRFYLAPRATWSDGKPVAPTDVRFTVAQMAGNPFLDQARAGGDPRQVEVLFKQVCLDPLSAMTFKVLPHGADARGVDFAHKPIGSGPYVLEGKQMVEGRPTLIFRAQRTGRWTGGQPAIRAIHFVVTTDPVKDFANGLLDMALDVQPEQIPAWKKRQTEAIQNAAKDTIKRLSLDIPLATPRTPNRRVYFLALNLGEKGPAALKSTEVRRALAKSIPRTRIIEEMRKASGLTTLHTPLSSLYPVGTWVPLPRNNPQADLYDREWASTLPKPSPAATLTVKIPDNDEALRAAFDTWAKEVETQVADGRLKLAIVQLPVQKLRADIEAGNYDLAYDWYDFPDDTFWLGPLLARLHVPDDEVAKQLNKAGNHREFGNVIEATRTLALRLDTVMPVLPLWQLDPLHLVHASVKSVDLDPRSVFGTIERWSLER